jgi:hypothetical protein
VLTHRVNLERHPNVGGAASQAVDAGLVGAVDDVDTAPSGTWAAATAQFSPPSVSTQMKLRGTGRG